MPYDTFATPPLDFSPLIGDDTEQKLKATLVPLLRKHGDVKRAYLARAHYDGKTGGLVLGLVTPGEDSETLVAEIGKLFASMFDSSQHLDVIFLSDEQLTAIKVAAAFYLRKSPALRAAVFGIAGAEFLALLTANLLVVRGFDMNGTLAIMLVLVLPAVLIGAWGRWLPFALTLLGVGAWVGLSVLIAGQISN
jgi:hypothetical protein